MKKLTLLLALALVAGACATSQTAQATGLVDSERGHPRSSQPERFRARF